MKTKTLYKLVALVIWLMLGWLIVYVYTYVKHGYVEQIMIPLLILIAAFFFFLISQLDKEKKRHSEYEKGQFLENWYNETVNKNGVEWIKATGEKIHNFYKGKKVNILSVAANKGTYEKAMYKNMVRLGSKVRILVTEICNIEHEENQQDGESMYEYASKIDAFECDKFLKNKGLDKVDIILDFKGAIWYQLTKKGDIKKLLDTYIEVLEDNGAIIIDNGKIPRIKKILYLMRHIFLGIPGTEQSTHYYINKRMRKNPEFEKYIKKHFSIESYEVDKTRNIDITILKKRAV